MKKLICIVALLSLPSVASAAPQTITILRNSGFWRFVSASPPILDWGGNPIPANSSIMSTSPRVSMILQSLAATDAARYTCSARAFYSGFDSFYRVAIASINQRSCVPSN